MIAMVTGGAASGKSAYAEALACGLSSARTYLATMSSDGAESQERIARHREQRRDAGFVTVERKGTLLGDAPASDLAAGVLLLDDVGNLVSNALFDAQGNMAEPGPVLDRLDGEFQRLSEQYEHVVVVGNEVGHDGLNFADESGQWVRAVGSLCCRIAARCDTVVEVVANVPHVIKGGAGVRP